jgi:DNA-binding CsgD family transcriptional regulator
MQTVNLQPWKPLTENERVVLDLMADGLTIAQVAERMQIPPRRARWYRDSLLNKFAVTSWRDLMRISQARAKQGIR